MDSYEKNTHKLKALWGDDDARQGAKIVFLKAIASTSELSAKITLDVLDELDRLLLPDPVEEKSQKNRGL